MNGGRDLATLLKALEPRLYPERYVFTTGPAPETGWFALICEEEGLSVVRPDPQGPWARISLGAYSSLEAVGLTAELSRALADVGISANIVAGLNHDHLFVPWSWRDEAMAILQALSAG